MAEVYEEIGRTLEEEWTEQRFICRRYRILYQKRAVNPKDRILPVSRASNDPYILSLDPDLAGAEWTIRGVVREIHDEFGFYVSEGTVERFLERLVADRRAKRFTEDGRYYYQITRNFDRWIRVRYHSTQDYNAGLPFLQFERVIKDCRFREITDEVVYVDLVKHGFSRAREMVDRLETTFSVLMPVLYRLKRREWISNWTLNFDEIATATPEYDEIVRLDRQLHETENEAEQAPLELSLTEQFQAIEDRNAQAVFLPKYWYPVNWFRFEYVLENFWYQEDERRNSHYEIRGEFEVPVDIAYEEVEVEFPDRDAVWEDCKDRAEEILLDWANDVYDLRMGWREGRLVMLRANVNFDTLMDIEGARQERSVVGLEELERIVLDEDAESDFNSDFKLFFEVGGWELNSGGGLRQNVKLSRRWYWE